MNFWENVEFELDKQGKYKKELAQAVGINASNFDKGKTRNSIPAADTALKIARFLKVPLVIPICVRSYPNDANNCCTSKYQLIQLLESFSIPQIVYDILCFIVINLQ